MTEPVQLFVLDIDGCISHPFQTPNWEAISEIRNLNRRSRSEEHIPMVTLCTGRPLPYAEAVAQWLDIRSPFVFESAALYNPAANRVETEVDADEDAGEADLHEGSEILIPVREMKQWLRKEILPHYPGTALEFTKMIDAGVVSPDKQQILEIYELIMTHVRSNYPELEVHRTDISVNILLAGNNKGRGIEMISRELDVPLEQMAYIGDSEGDLLPLKRVGMSFAPLNAIDRVREISEVMPYETSEAVLAAYRKIIRRNRELELQT